MKNKFKITGLWILYQILTDKNLRDKEKIIYSFILFFSNNKGYCSIRNKYLEHLLHRSTKRISSIINTLQYKKYIYVVPRNNREERKLYPLVDIKDIDKKVLFKGLLYRKIKPIRKNDDTYCKKVQDKYYQKVQQDNLKNVNVLKSKNKNYKKYNRISNYEGREYEPEFLETLYANL